MNASPIDDVLLPQPPIRHARPARWRLLWAAALLVLFVLSIVLLAGDREPLALDDRVRKQLPGRFVALSDGYTNYEVGGPERGPVVLLVPGVSICAEPITFAGSDDYFCRSRLATSRPPPGDRGLLSSAGWWP
jgi:hypothetical protein